MFDVSDFRKGFPQLERRMGPNPMIYFDNGASTLKHSLVADRVNSYNRFETSNVHRGAHLVSRQGTELYEGARKKVQSFIGAGDTSEIIFTRGTTESINLVAYCLEEQIQSGDEILITPFEHHSNIVPWQRVCERKGAHLKVVSFDPRVGMSLDSFKEALSDKTKLAAFLFYSNSFGQRLPVEDMIAACNAKNILTLVDGAQAVLTERIDVQKLDCDFLAFSGHKMFGPYGTGICYMKTPWPEKFGPYQTGGSMIDRVSFEKTDYALSPQKFEAGTPNVSGALGLGVAIDVLQALDFSEQHKHVLQLRKHLLEGLKIRPKIKIYDFSGSDHAGIVSFNLEGAHCSDVGTLLDRYGIAVRAGHHCTQPLMDLMGIPGTVRVSLCPFNTAEEVHYFFEVMDKVEEFFQ